MSLQVDVFLALIMILIAFNATQANAYPALQSYLILLILQKIKFFINYY